MDVVVLGAGLVGGPMALDLARDPKFTVTAADRDAAALKKLHAAEGSIRTVTIDLSDAAALTSLVSDHDLVLSAVPGFMGFQTLKTVIEAGKNAVDIAFFPEDPFELDTLAQEKGVAAIVDCGVAPGMSNLLAGSVDSRLDETDTVLIYVGGLPEVREWPYEYKAVFSPIDVIEEYTRPARYIENGALVTREALSDPELLHFPGVGTLEAFNSDGLRTLIHTITAPNKKEKTLRYPGHIDKIAVLRNTGFFDEAPIEIGGTSIRPIDVTAKLLFPKWELKEGEVDITVMQVIVEGMKGGRRVRYTYDLLDRYDPETRIHSMARTTGYAATMAVRMFGEGLYDRKGISPPEFVGRNEACVEFILRGLEERGVRFKRTIAEL